MFKTYQCLNKNLLRLFQHPIKYNSFKYYTSLAEKSKTFIDNEKRIKILSLEIDVLRQEGRKAPDVDTLNDANWEHILNIASKSGRRKYYQFLWQIEKKNESLKLKKNEKRLELEVRKQKLEEENKENEHIIYGLNHNTFFLRIYDSTINRWNNNKLIRAMMFEQKLIIDCSYDAHMNPREAQNAAKQLMLCFAENRAHDDPFDLHYFNVNPNTSSIKHLHNYIPNMMDTDFPMNIHNESFLDCYDKNQLVYLTPHCHNDLVEYNNDDIYIIGAMVDKQNNEPLSLAKAKHMGLRMARLPLDRYLNWAAGSGKSLTLNQMVKIMLELKSGEDWDSALKCVPRRKLYNEDYRNRSTNLRTDAERRRYNKFDFKLDSWGKVDNKKEKW